MTGQTPPAAAALCCQCGSRRTYRRARNTVADCGSDTTLWHRMTGDLKCSACNAVTRHALLRTDQNRDFAEQYQAAALGGPPPDSHTDIAGIRNQYRQGLPRNPELAHLYWLRDAETARQHGLDHTLALCGDLMPTPNRDPRPGSRNRGDADDFGRPREQSDVDLEDLDTGLSWIHGDCVNCLAVWNRLAAQQRRSDLADHLTRLLAAVNADLPDNLVAHFSAAITTAYQQVNPQRGAPPTGSA